MSKSLNFNNVKKTYLTVTLADENETTVMIGTPTKAMMDDLLALQERLTDATEGTTPEVLGDMYELCAKLMSRNKAGVQITKEELEKIFDFEDLSIFFNAYMEFVTNVVSGKN